MFLTKLATHATRIGEIVIYRKEAGGVPKNIRYPHFPNNIHLKYDSVFHVKLSF